MEVWVPEEYQNIQEEQRFWAKVEMSGCCMEWRGSLSNGRGMFRKAGIANPVIAHRWAYESIYGPIPEGLEIDHLCENPTCVNPEHLEPVTRGENMARYLESRKKRSSTRFA